MFFEFANVLVFVMVGIGFVVVNLLIARFLRPRSTDQPGKREIYECGEPTIGQAWIRFDIRFYTIALMFVIFDVEVALLFPWGVVFRDLVEEGLGLVALVEAGTFIAILMVGLAYVWSRGDIDWAATAPVRTERLPDARTEVRLGAQSASGASDAGVGGGHV